jgi:transposase
VVLLETRHVKAALSAMVVKTDRKGARGIAQLIRILRRAFANSSPTTQCCVRAPSSIAKPKDGERNLGMLLRGLVFTY